MTKQELFEDTPEYHNILLGVLAERRIVERDQSEVEIGDLRPRGIELLG